MFRLLILCSSLFLSLSIFAQKKTFTQADSIRGMLRPERTCYDVLFYDLDIDIDFETKAIKGSNLIRYYVKQGFNMLQIDLFDNMVIEKIVHKGAPLQFHRRQNAVFVDFGDMQEADQIDELKVYFHGVPRKAITPPWDGGFSWTTDKDGSPWLGVSCEGIGASLWWPNKDHLSDEPDSMRIRCTVPAALYCVANGVLRSTQEIGDKKSFEWFVSYPINNYNVTLNVAKYTHFSDTFVSPTDGSKLPLDYYVLPYNLEKAKKQFVQTQDVLRVFEKYLDKYPFWNDGFALVETSYLGMEHQGAIAYGNKYMNGYLGRHPHGIPVDFIILHETGHEWWGNSVSCVDHGEMWLHESFTTYMEVVYVEEMHGYDDAVRYLKFYNNYIENKQPMLGPKNVNYDSHDSDMYYKGAAMLHSLRRSIQDDKLWWNLIKTYYQKHKMGYAVTEDFINHVQEKTGKDYGYFFEQYLQYPKIPTLVYRLNQKGKDLEISYKWIANVPDFKMPVFIDCKKKSEVLYPTTSWQSSILKNRKDKNLEFEYGLFNTKEEE